MNAVTRRGRGGYPIAEPVGAVVWSDAVAFAAAGVLGARFTGGRAAWPASALLAGSGVLNIGWSARASFAAAGGLKAWLSGGSWYSSARVAGAGGMKSWLSGGTWYDSVSLQGAGALTPAEVVPIQLTQANFRYRIDSDPVDDATPTWGAAQDVFYATHGEPFRLRVNVVDAAWTPPLTTMNPGDHYGCTFADNNLTVNRAGASNDPAAARSTTAHAHGKWHIEFTVHSMGTQGQASGPVGLGIASANSRMGFFLIGTDGTSAGVANYIPARVMGSDFVAPFGTFGVGDTVAIEFDLDAQLFWYQNLTSGPFSWNASGGSADPASGTGGSSIAFNPLGMAYYICVGLNISSGAGSVTVNFGATPFALAPSAGFLNWDAEPPAFELRASYNGGPYVSVGPPTFFRADEINMTISSDGMTATQTSLGYYAGARAGVSKSHGKYHAEFTVNASDGASVQTIGFTSSLQKQTRQIGGANWDVGLIWDNAAPLTQLRSNGVTGASWAVGIANGDIVAFEIDLDARLIWAQNLTSGPANWNGNPAADPASGVGGFDINPYLIEPVGTPYFPTVRCDTFATVLGSFTLNLGATPFALAPSAGFLPWIAGTVSPATAGNAEAEGTPILIPRLPPDLSGPNMIGYWPFDTLSLDFAGGVAHDLSVVGNDGSMSGLTSGSVVTGRVQQGLLFDGASSIISVPSYNYFDPAKPFSLSVWASCFAIGSGGECVLLKLQSTNGNYWKMVYNNVSPNLAGIGFHSQGAGGATTGGLPPVDTTLRLITITYNGVAVVGAAANWAIYINGVSQPVFNAGLASARSNTTFIGGNGTGTNFWNGIIDELRIYNRMLSAAEVAAYYATNK